MPPLPNLISNSLLINETIALLKASGGSVSVEEVVGSVMKINHAEISLARLLVSDLAETDPRLNLREETLELIVPENDSRLLFETDFVVFDFETTGAKCPPCRVTEIGAYRIERGKITEEFQTLINPEIPIPLFITRLTGISNAMVKHAPRFRDVAQDFLQFIGDAVLVAHNAHFDLRFLNHEISRIYGNYSIANPHLCTVQLSRKLLPQIENHRLNTVANHYSIYLENHHRAACDAYATAQIFVNLLHHLNDLGARDLQSIRKVKI